MRTDDLYFDHQREPALGQRCPTCKRIRTERAIARMTASAFLRAGFTISVYDGEEFACKRATRLTDVMAAVFSTDQDTLVIRDQDGVRQGSILFIYGNDGWDVISDYSTSLESYLAPINAYSDRIAA